MRIEIVKDSVVFQKTDAIVNAANATLLGGGGVDGAIHDAAGDELYHHFAGQNRTCKPGDAVTSPGFKLPAKYIVHTVGPIWHGGVTKEAETLTSCYRNCLEEAARLGCRSIAFCCVSTGIYGYPLEAATKVALETVRSWLEERQSDILARFCCYSDEEYEVYIRVAEDLHIF